MRTKFNISPGDKFNRFTVISQLPRPFRSEPERWLCLCECGRQSVVIKGNLYKGLTKSCGCLKNELLVPSGYKKNFPELYRKFKSAKSRCNNSKNVSYPNYGGRGIKFLFKDGFVDFVNYCLEIGWKEGLQIDRIDNNGNYERGNIRFVTHKENQNNKGHI